MEGEWVNGKSGVSPEMAIRLDKAFGGSAEVWLGLQMDYDLVQAMKRDQVNGYGRWRRPLAMITHGA